MLAFFTQCLYLHKSISNTTLHLQKQYLPHTSSHQNSIFLCILVCVRLFLWSVTLHSVCCGLFHLHPAERWHPAHLPLHSSPWGEELPAGLSHLWGASVSLDPSPQDQQHLVLIRRKLYGLAFVSTRFTSALVFYSESNVLTKAAWRGHFSLTRFVCTLNCDERLQAMFV